MDRFKNYLSKIKNVRAYFAKKFLMPRIARQVVPLLEDEMQTKVERNRKMDMYIEFVLIFILGILIGIAVKTEANKKITIGFDDYQMKLYRPDFNIDQLQADTEKKDAQNQGGSGQDTSAIGATCSDASVNN